MRTSRERIYHFLGFIFGIIFMMILQVGTYPVLIPLFIVMIFCFIFGEVE